MGGFHPIGFLHAATWASKVILGPAVSATVLSDEFPY